MRRVILVVLCCVLLATTLLAANEVTQHQSSATVAGDGSCQINVVVTINLEEAKESLYFPLPAEATGVTVNGSSVRTKKDGSVGLVNLKFLAGYTGSYTLTFHYTLPNVVTTREDGKLLLEVPLLSGFAMPVENMDFTITLPADIEAVPSFYSGYYQDSIESRISSYTNGRTISGAVTGQLLDSETLSMSLVVPADMFPATVTTDENSLFFPIAMGICAAMALLYWLIFLRCAPLWPSYRTVPPEGISAGEVCSRLVGTGADLTLMVVTWAQLGYLVISRDDSGRIFLHKRMEMGNERSAFENRCYRSLFGRKRTVDGTGYHYARLCSRIAEETPNLRGQYLPGSGNPLLLRGLGAGIGIFAAAAMGASLATGTAWRIVLAVLLGVLGALASWHIQAGCRCIHLRDKKPGLIGLALSAVWLLAGLLTGLWDLALLAVLGQILTGLGAYYGGRRTENARLQASELLGLRRYLKTASRQELQRILRSNPDYYYELAPYALALGVDKAFAKRFGRIRQPGCHYLVAAVEAHTALKWYPLLRDAADTLDARQKKLKYERFTKV